MKIILAAIGIALAAILLWKPSPASGPEAIRYGRDACDRCRMHLATPGFAAERRDAKGALHKYDDLGCMLIAASRDESGEAWVEDHAGDGFVPLTSATFVAGKSLGTPMNYGVVAFRDAAAAGRFAASHDGKVVPLEQLLRGLQEEHR
jgi:copper chaperone NosL